MYKMHHPKVDIDGLYMKRKKRPVTNCSDI
jgi:hypothetical protein